MRQRKVISIGKMDAALTIVCALTSVHRTTDDPLQEKASQVTLALRKTTELMRAELDSSVMASQLLGELDRPVVSCSRVRADTLPDPTDESAQTIKSTNSLYVKYSSLLDQSSHLIRALERTNYWDRICILAGVAFFLCTCGWILKRRVFDRAVGGLATVVFGAGRLAGKARKGQATASSVVLSQASDIAGLAGKESGRPPTRLADALEAAAPVATGGSALTEVVQEGGGSLGESDASSAVDDARSRDEL